MATKITDLSVAEHLTSPPFTVHISTPENTTSTFHIPRTLLTTHSAYFSALISGPFAGRETASQAVTLHDTDLPAFRLFLDFLFLGDYHPQLPRAPGRNGAYVGEEVYLVHARVYGLAERLCAEGLKRVAVRKMGAELHRAYACQVRGAYVVSCPTLSVETLGEVVRLVYLHTRDAVFEERNGEAERVLVSCDQMRMVVARYFGGGLAAMPGYREAVEGLREEEGCEELEQDLRPHVRKSFRFDESLP